MRDFSLRESGDDLIINWTVAAGFSCTDVQVQRSSDSVHFETLYIYSGICGSQTEDLDYSWTWSKPPVNEKIYFRLDLGAFGYSNVISHRLLEYGTEGYLLFPFPVNEETLLRFPNEKREPVNFYLFDSRGNENFSLKSLKTDALSFAGFRLLPGFYFFRIEFPDGRNLNGNILIL